MGENLAQALSAEFWWTLVLLVGSAGFYVKWQWNNRLEFRRNRCKRSSCRHSRAAHMHHRRGTDCSVCHCPRFKGGMFF